MSLTLAERGLTGSLAGELVRRVPVRLLYMAAILANVVCQFGVTVALARNVVGPALFLAVHVTLSAALLFPAFLLSPSSAQGAGFLHLALWTFMGGPFGSVIAGTLMVLNGGDKAAQRPFGDWLEDEIGLASPVGGQLRSAYLDGRLRIRGASAAKPFVDVIAEGQKEAKFEILSIIGRRFDPTLTPIVRAALKDADPSVRVLASTVTAKLQTRFAKELFALEASALLASNDPAGWVRLARARSAYAASGLLERSQAEAEIAQAKAAIEAALAVAPQDESARRELAIIMQNAEPDGAPPSESVPPDDAGHPVRDGAKRVACTMVSPPAWMRHPETALPSSRAGATGADAVAPARALAGDPA